MARRKNRAYNFLIVFLIQPFLAFLLSLKNLTSRSGRLVFVAFSTLWGYSQSFAYPSADCYRIAASFCQYPVRSFSEVVNSFLEGRAVDGYLLFTNFLVHLVSDNAKVFFALLGFIYGLCCYECFNILIKDRRNGSGRYLFMVLFLLFATASLANIATPRFWTAEWLSLLVFLKLLKGNRMWVLVSVALPMLHFSFLPITFALVFISFLIKPISQFSSVLFWLVSFMFIISFIIPETVIGRLIPQEILDENTKLAAKYSYVSGVQSNRILQETSAYREANIIVTSFFHFLTRVGSYLMLLFFYLKRKLIIHDSSLWRFYSSVLIIAFVAYFMSVIPSTGWRFINLLWLFLLSLLYKYYDIFRPRKFLIMTISLYTINIYTIAFMFYLSYCTLDLLLLYAPLPLVIIKGFGFLPIDFI